MRAGSRFSAMWLGRLAWPIVVGGCYRSGTSLVRRILDSHSGIHCGPEVKFFSDVADDYLLDPLGHARFFRTVRQLGLDDDALLPIFGRGLVEAHRLAARRRGKRRWADKNPENVLYLDRWSSLLGGRMLFVHCVRNPLDTIASLSEAGFPLAVPAPFAAKVDLYRLFMEAGLRGEEAHPSRSLRVRYEDLVREPEAQLRRLTAFLGERFEPRMLDFNASPHQEGLEDPKVGSTTGIHADSVGRWRRVLSDDEVRCVVRRCGDLFERLGYQPPVLDGAAPAERRGAPAIAHTVSVDALPAPLVIGAIGGSGTRVVARIARRAGVFMGADLNESEDALAFVEAYDRWINRYVAAAWDPMSDDDLARMRDEVAVCIRRHRERIPSEQAPWGWKEPRSLYLLPFFHGLFPGLKFIHVVRDARHMAFSTNRNQLRKHGDAALGGFGGDLPDPVRAAVLWNRVNLAAADYGESRLGDRYLRIPFEDLLLSPKLVAGRLLRFVGREAPIASWGIVGDVRVPPPTGTWQQQDPALIALVEQHAAEGMKRFGYTKG